MSRDTQFAQFAKALWDELPDVPEDHFQVNAYDDWSTACEKIITQRAYDLVGYALIYSYTHGVIGTREEATHQIPDLTELPGVSQ